MRILTSCFDDDDIDKSERYISPTPSFDQYHEGRHFSSSTRSRPVNRGLRFLYDGHNNNQEDDHDDDVILQQRQPYGVVTPPSQHTPPSSSTASSFMDDLLSPILHCVHPPLNACLPETVTAPCGSSSTFVIPSSHQPEAPQAAASRTTLPPRRVLYHHSSTSPTFSAAPPLEPFQGTKPRHLYHHPNGNTTPSPHHYTTPQQHASNNPSTPMQPQPHDVLCGRGHNHTAHPGNRNFRDLVAANQPLYATLTKKEKLRLAREIVRLIHRRGRFMARGSGGWHEMDWARSVEKASQALRDAPTTATTTKRARHHHRNSVVSVSIPAALQTVYAGDDGDDDDAVVSMRRQEWREGMPSSTTARRTAPPAGTWGWSVESHLGTRTSIAGPPPGFPPTMDNANNNNILDSSAGSMDGLAALASAAYLGLDDDDDDDVDMVAAQ